MPKLYFSNPGEIDLRAVTTLGVNVKLGDNPIGHFGTGIKYAIAGILRLGGEITIWSGEKGYAFRDQEESIRGKHFNIVTMTQFGPGSGYSQTVPLGFTTDLGKDWEPWMYYRELRSNCADEGGEFGELGYAPTAGETLIEVDCEEISAAHYSREVFWLTPQHQTLLWEGAGLQVYGGISNCLFYHGIKATSRDSSKTEDWNFKYSLTSECKLTEDRTFASFYDSKVKIGKALTQCTNREVLNTVLGEAPESQLDYDHWDLQPSAEFFEVVLERLQKKLKVASSARNRLHRHDEAAVEEAELEIPSHYEDMERLAPEEAPEITTSRYDYDSQTDERIKGLEKELAYWKACARKLAHG